MGIPSLVATAFVIGLSGAMAPGSLLVVVITETIRKGFWAGPIAVMGHAFLEAISVFLLSKGLGEILVYEKNLGIIGILGGTALVYLGYSTAKFSRTASLSFDSIVDESQASPSSSRISTALAGMAASISNPYWILWWATVGATYVASSLRHGALGPTSFYFGHIAADLVWYSLVSFFVTAGKRFLSDRIYRGVLLVCGILVVLLGIYFLRLGFTLALG
jgi:threonine/homoserine/homoserine lactone efflux protein